MRCRSEATGPLCCPEWMAWRCLSPVRDVLAHLHMDPVGAFRELMVYDLHSPSP